MINAGRLYATPNNKKTKKKLQAASPLACWTNKNGSVFEGKPSTSEGEEEVPSGPGSCTFTPEDNPLILSSEGGWWQGKRHLLGIITFRSTGNSFFAQWENGILVSPLRRMKEGNFVDIFKA